MDKAQDAANTLQQRSDELLGAANAVKTSGDAAVSDAVETAAKVQAAAKAEHAAVLAEMESALSA